MGAGKIFCILGGIITLVATFLFSFASVSILTVDYYYFYIGLIQNLSDLFTSGEILWIIAAVVFLVIMVSGVLIILGVKSRACAIIGSILAIFLGVFYILVAYLDLPTNIEELVLEFIQEPLVEGIIPFDVPLGDISLGTYLMLGGGVLGLIGGIMGPSDF